MRGPRHLDERRRYAAQLQCPGKPKSERQSFTIEPGVYFIGSLLDKLRASPAGRHVDWAHVDALRPYGGIRIEDDILVTASGAEIMTRSVPKAAASRLRPPDTTGFPRILV